MAAPTPEALIEDFFRHEAGKLTAALARTFGLKDLALAEDIVQDTLLKALEYWRFHPLPDNPKAWLYRAARNRALDALKRSQRHAAPTDEATLDRTVAPSATEARLDEALLPAMLSDGQLRMMFACCTPALPTETQVMLILKVLCGFGAREIARAFLQSEETVAKRLYRARKQLAESGFDLDLPPAAVAPERLESVLLALYLLFNEGYNATETADFLREDLCVEALRLGALLVSHTATATGPVHALLALMHFHAARFPARRDAQGGIVLLEAQDRRTWLAPLIEQGMAHLEQAFAQLPVTPYHLEAAIAGAHTTARTYAETPWPTLLQYYDQLYALKPTPVVALNRAVVVAELEGPVAAIPLVEALPGYEKHHRFLSVLAHLYTKAGEPTTARTLWQRALAVCPSPREKAWIEQQMTATVL